MKIQFKTTATSFDYEVACTDYFTALGLTAVKATKKQDSDLGVDCIVEGIHVDFTSSLKAKTNQLRKHVGYNKETEVVLCPQLMERGLEFEDLMDVGRQLYQGLLKQAEEEMLLGRG